MKKINLFFWVLCVFFALSNVGQGKARVNEMQLQILLEGEEQILVVNVPHKIVCKQPARVFLHFNGKTHQAGRTNTRHSLGHKLLDNSCNFTSFMLDAPKELPKKIKIGIFYQGEKKYYNFEYIRGKYIKK